MGETDTLVVGKVLKPRGLKGELKIRLLTNVAHVFESKQKLLIRNKTFIIDKSAFQGEDVYCILSGIDSIEKAEQLRDADVKVERKNLNLADDEILADDLLGFDVVGETGQNYGKIKSIENHGGGDIIVTESVQFPYEDSFVIETNMKKKTIIVRDEMLLWEEI